MHALASPPSPPSPPAHLPQVAARLVEPVQSHLAALLKHRKYKPLAWEQAKVCGKTGKELGGRLVWWTAGRQGGGSSAAGLRKWACRTPSKSPPSIAAHKLRREGATRGDSSNSSKQSLLLSL